MKSTIVPIFCALVLSALSAAGVSHWWSVRQLLATSGWQPAPKAAPAVPEKTPLPAPPKPATEVAVKKATVVPVPQAPAAAAQPATADLSIQQLVEINRKTLEEFRRLRDENRDLRDQMAETNRDLMKLEFRVDTHSESFRPLPMSDDRQDATLGTTPDIPEGVLPPLDETLSLPTQ